MSNPLLVDTNSKIESYSTNTEVIKKRKKNRKCLKKPKIQPEEGIVTAQNTNINSLVTNSCENIQNIVPDNSVNKVNKKKKRKLKKPNSETVTSISTNEIKIVNNSQKEVIIDNLISRTFNEQKLTSSKNDSNKESSSLKPSNNNKNGNINNTCSNTIIMTSRNSKNDSGQTDEEKSREEILAQRKVKKLMKQTNKNNKTLTSSNEISIKAEATSKNAIESNASKTTVKATTPIKVPTDNEQVDNSKESELPQQQKLSEKTREQIIAEREAKKLAKQQAKNKSKKPTVQFEGKNIKDVENASDNTKVVADTTTLKVKIVETANTDLKKKSSATTTKAERRAIQEAQRQAKAINLLKKQEEASLKRLSTSPSFVDFSKVKDIKKSDAISIGPIMTFDASNVDDNVKLFNHLHYGTQEQNLFVNHPNICPSIVQLGQQYSTRTIVGSNARCIAFLNALKGVISEFKSPPKTEFCRSLEANLTESVDYLHRCRPLAVSVINAHKYVKSVLTQLSINSRPEIEVKEELLECVDTYINDQIEKAAQAINDAVQEKICDGDVILTFGCSSLIYHIIDYAYNRRNVSFQVVCVDSKPFHEGQEMLRRLNSKGVKCKCVLINAISFIMPEVTKVLMGAHSILANGYVMSRAGTAQVALVARSFNVPVLICCEIYKFSERVQTDAIVCNELGNPDDIVRDKFNDDNDDDSDSLKHWRTYSRLKPLNLNYDITPPELITAVVTERAILPCTSVPVILRINQ